MTIDLSQFVGKTVDVTLNNEQTHLSVKVKANKSDVYPYAVAGATYTKEGYFSVNWQYGRHSHVETISDIKEIKLSTPEQPMNIDLSQYVDKDVKVILKNDRTQTGRLQLRGNYYNFYFGYCLYSYFRNGTSYWNNSHFDIVKIELVDPEPKQITLNALESKTLDAIATALVPEAIKYIESHERYAEVMQALIIEFVEKNLGSENGELPFMIFDRMFLVKGRD
jgi:hypothetical protein